MVLDLAVDRKNDCGDYSGRQRMGRSEQYRRYSRERTADLRQEIDKCHPKSPQKRERHAQDEQCHGHNDASDQRRQAVAGHVAGGRAASLAGNSGESFRVCRRHRVQYPLHQRGPVQQQENDQHDECRQRRQQRYGALAYRQRRPRQVLAEFDKLRFIAADPPCEVVLAYEMTNPAPAVLSLSDIPGQGVR